MSNTYQRLRDRQEQEDWNIERQENIGKSWDEQMREEMVRVKNNQEKEPFERELRYLVLKYKDIEKYLSEAETLMLEIISQKLLDNTEERNYVVVEDDWGIYEDVWTLVEQEYNND